MRFNSNLDARNLIKPSNKNQGRGFSIKPLSTQTKTDKSQLVSLLRQAEVTDRLANVTDLANHHASRGKPSEEYEAAVDAFIDGFEIRLGHISRLEAEKSKELLLNSI